ncbi:hypothetical protein Tco_0983062, partial [Tanacetum coccineum]
MLASPTNTSTPSTPTVATTNTLTVAYGLTGYCSPNVPNIGPLPSYLPSQQFGGPPDFYYPPMHTRPKTLHDPTTSAWNMDTGASSHLNNSVNSLSEILIR